MLRHRHQANEFATSRLDRKTESEPVISRNAISCDQPAARAMTSSSFQRYTWKANIPQMVQPVVIFHRSISLSNYGGLKSKVIEAFSKNGLFRRKRPLTRKFSKICSERIHRDTDPHIVSKFCEIWTTGSRWNRALLTRQKKFPLALTSAPIASKICQG